MPAIHVLDLNFRGASHAIAAFLVIGPDGPVLVESGPGSTVETLQSELARHGVRPADVRDVLLTHIHLDHGGAAGWWARQGARIHVHHVGAPHLIDPTRLLASAGRIYGDMMQTLWGEVLPVPPECLVAHGDGDVIAAGGLRFTAHDTPGHAYHHLVYQLDGTAFTGDLAGVRLPATRHVRMPTPPPEFDLDAWLASVARMRALRFERLYLTHFGGLEGAGEIAAHWDRVAQLLPEDAALVGRALAEGGDRDAAIAALTAADAERQLAAGMPEEDRARYASVGPLGMSADGLIRYHKKKAS